MTKAQDVVGGGIGVGCTTGEGKVFQSLVYN